MARRRKGRPIHGWINLDKPADLTSSQAVGRIKRMLDAAKVGHAGTLDPLATGILPIALGEATKTVAYVQDSEKQYRFTVRWGEARDSDDVEGAVVATSASRPDRAAIEAALPRFIGEYDQLPPRYSAIKVAGERAYDLARAGVEVSLESRRVIVYDLALVAQPDPDHAVFEVSCGRGFYVRALARDLAESLGTYGHVSALRRLAVGPFDEDASVTLDQLEAAGPERALADYLLPVETVLADIPALALTAEEAAKLRNGQPVALVRRQDRQRLDEIRQLQAEDPDHAGDADAPAGTALATALGDPVALVRLDGAMIRPVRLFNL